MTRKGGGHGEKKETYPWHPKNQKQKKKLHKMVDAWGILPHIIKSCSINKQLSVLMAQYIKCLIYIVLILRLNLAFGDSPLRKNVQCIITFIYVCTIAYFIVATVITPF
ncbi:hypothetical protein RFI_10918, partial [Reticulomyxa filosa]